MDKQTIKNILSYSAANVYFIAISVVMQFTQRHWLSPAILGLWSFSLVIQAVMQNFDIGILSASTRLYPRLISEGKRQEAIDLRFTCFWLNLLFGLVLCFAVTIYPLIFDSNPNHVYCYYIAAVIILLNFLGNSLVTFYQNAQDFTGLSRNLFAINTITLVLVVFLTYAFSIKGLVIAYIVSYMLKVFLLRKSMYLDSGNLRHKFSKCQAKYIFKYALSLRASDFAMSIYQNIDSIIVAKFFSLETLAIYMTARQIISQTSMIPSWVSSVFIVRLNALYKPENKIISDDVRIEVMKSLSVIYFILLPTVIMVFSKFSHIIILLYLPKYTGSLHYLTPLFFLVLCQPSATMVRNFWMVEGNFKAIFFSTAIPFGLFIAVMISKMNQLDLSFMLYSYLGSWVLYFILLFATVGRRVLGVKYLTIFMFVLAIQVLLIIYSLAGDEYMNKVILFSRELISMLVPLVNAAIVCSLYYVFTRRMRYAQHS